MSAPAAERQRLDQYFTPLPLARALVALVDQTGPGLAGQVVLEPSVGEGAFVVAAREARAGRILAVDIDMDVRGLQLGDAWMVGDFLDPVDRPIGEPVDVVLGNPPFTNAEAHARRALDVVRPGGTVAFLLLLAFLESKERVPFFAEHPPVSVHVLVQRPSFAGPGEKKGKTDQRAYGWFQWRKGWRGTPSLGWTSWR